MTNDQSVVTMQKDRLRQFGQTWHEERRLFCMKTQYAHQSWPSPTIRGRNLKSMIWIALVVLLMSLSTAAANQKLAFWDEQRKGANGVGGIDANEWFGAAAGFGIEYVRLCPVTWSGVGRDFLIGDADNFTHIPSEDMKKLKAVLDVAEKHDVKIVLTMFSLPGARYRQDNDYKFDYRLWNQESFQQQAIQFWVELATTLKDHPAIVAYNPLNEPHPARQFKFESGRTKGFSKWLKKNKGKTTDLNLFNKRIVEAIREVDDETPIMLDCWFHDSPDGFPFLEPLKDDAVLYSFHCYYPWEYTAWRINKERFSYPDKMPKGSSKKTARWTQQNLLNHIQPVVKWAKKNQIETNRIVAGEFGCDRKVSGAKEYLSDLISIFNEKGWHWAFYTFRSPDWEGMDYELGTEKVNWKYWQAREAGKNHEDLIERRDNPLWEIFKSEFKERIKK